MKEDAAGRPLGRARIASLNAIGRSSTVGTMPSQRSRGATRSNDANACQSRGEQMPVPRTYLIAVRRPRHAGNASVLYCRWRDFLGRAVIPSQR